MKNSFEYVDRKIGPRAKSLKDDDLIKLRALRVIYDTIKNVSSEYVKAGDPSDAIYIRTSKTGGTDDKVAETIWITNTENIKTIITS